MLQTLRGNPPDWTAYREARAPLARCGSCGSMRTIREFSAKQWDLARSNRNASCMRCTSHGAGPFCRQNWKPAGQQQFCTVCNQSKIEDAFPKAQLRQDQAAERQRCLVCCLEQEQMLCQQCEKTKAASEFDSMMCTLPTGFVVCTCCQGALKADIARRWGWFECRGCKLFLLKGAAFHAEEGPSSSASQRSPHCLNCAWGHKRRPGQHTCRKCGRTWAEEQANKNKRGPRLCPHCRR